MGPGGPKEKKKNTAGQTLTTEDYLYAKEKGKKGLLPGETGGGGDQTPRGRRVLGLYWGRGLFWGKEPCQNPPKRKKKGPTSPPIQPCGKRVKTGGGH